jgi:hypothetical protein
VFHYLSNSPMNISGTVGPDIELSVGEIERARFSGCHVRASADPSRRVMLKDGFLKRCTSDGCWIHGAIIANITVEDLAGGGRMGTWFRGCVFSNVVLKGRFASPLWQRSVSNDPDVNRLFDADAAKRYQSIDRALDIAEATFQGFTIFQGIPPALIRRNEPTQFVLHRECRDEVRAVSSTLLVVCKTVESEPDGVVFTFGGKSERDKRRAEECSELREKGLLD